MLLSTAEESGGERRGALCEQEEHRDGSERDRRLNIVLEMGSVLKFFCRIRVKVIYFITYIQLNILRKYQAVLSHPLILKSKFVQHQIYFTNPMSDVLFIYYYIHNNIMIILMVSIFAVQFISKNGNIE